MKKRHRGKTPAGYSAAKPWKRMKDRARLRKAGGEAFCAELIRRMYGNAASKATPHIDKFRTEASKLRSRSNHLDQAALAHMVGNNYLRPTESKRNYLLTRRGAALAWPAWNMTLRHAIPPNPDTHDHVD